MPLLSATDWPAIRACIDVSLTVDDVPDSVIALPQYQGAGEARVLLRFPAALALLGAELTRAHAAAVLFTAALVAEALPRITQEGLGRRSYTATIAHATADMLSIAANLRARAEAELAEIALAQGTYFAVVQPRMFAIARGSRGG